MSISARLAVYVLRAGRNTMRTRWPFARSVGGNVRRILHANPVIFKGHGFYSTDRHDNRGKRMPE